MAEQLLHVVKRHPAFGPSRSGCMPQIVEVQIDFGEPLAAGIGEPALRPLRFVTRRSKQRHLPGFLERGHRPANLVPEHERVGGELVTIRIELGKFQNGCQASRNRQDAVLSVFGILGLHQELASLQIDTPPL